MCGRFTLKTDPETLTETFPGFTTPAPDEMTPPLQYRSLSGDCCCPEQRREQRGIFPVGTDPVLGKRSQNRQSHD